MATVVRATELRDAPYRDAAVVAKLMSESSLMVVNRKGGWCQAQFGEQEGWVRMTALRFEAKGVESESTAGEDVSAAFNFLTTGRSGYTGVTAATGIRGLDSADVMNATPNHKAVRDLDWFKADLEEAKQFAAEGGLVAKEVAYVEEEKSGGFFSGGAKSQEESAEFKKKSPFPIGLGGGD
ncbi:hypothetical protein BOW51_01605 [Solemya velesiana gill symbiont]|uniref:SH3b domain-containing protein n=1 Tax=Solemya velesiana gill symbiont TaxID=1918948 RepID=A0A1T2KXM4_9GAMM|nr:hypothetical protein BOW51_01605 [Solemya velesiana gill symbiont]